MSNAGDYERAASAWDTGDDLLAGKLVYEALRAKDRPAWAADVLQLACRAVAPPTVVTAILEIAADENRWGQAREAFVCVRRLALCRRAGAEQHDERLDALLDLAEKTAKVIYNASGCSAPFDHNAGWKIGPSLRRLAAAVGDSRCSEAARAAFLPAGKEA